MEEEEIIIHTQTQRLKSWKPSGLFIYLDFFFSSSLCGSQKLQTERETEPVALLLSTLIHLIFRFSESALTADYRNWLQTPQETAGFD